MCRCLPHRSLAEHLLAVCRDEGAVQHSANLWAGVCKGIGSAEARRALLTGSEDMGAARRSHSGSPPDAEMAIIRLASEQGRRSRAPLCPKGSKLY